MRSTHNNHCPIEGEMKQGSAAFSLCCYVCVSIALSPEMCVSPFACKCSCHGMFLPSSHRQVFGSRGAAGTFCATVKHLWQAVIKPAAERMLSKRGGGETEEWKTQIMGKRRREPLLPVWFKQLWMWEIKGGKTGKQRKETEWRTCEYSGRKKGKWMLQGEKIRNLMWWKWEELGCIETHRLQE